MATALPIKTTVEDIDILANYMKNRVGYVPLDHLRAAVPAPHGDARKIETMKFLGLLESDATGLKLTDDGRKYAANAGNDKATVLARRLRSVPLYSATLEWLHYSKVRNPTKTDIANYWVDKHSGSIGSAKGAALTDAAVLFLRVAGGAGAGKFVPAGVGRDTHLKIDTNALEAIVTGTEPAEEEPAARTDGREAGHRRGREEGRGVGATVELAPAVNINVQIHIAADAKPVTIEEIFKNMRKYVLNPPNRDAGAE